MAPRTSFIAYKDKEQELWLSCLLKSYFSYGSSASYKTLIFASETFLGAEPRGVVCFRIMFVLCFSSSSAALQVNSLYFISFNGGHHGYRLWSETWCEQVTCCMVLKFLMLELRFIKSCSASWLKLYWVGKLHLSEMVHWRRLIKLCYMTFMWRETCHKHVLAVRTD